MFTQQNLNPEIFSLFKKHFPDTISGVNTITIPTELTLTRLNSKLNRDGIEAWSRFPGLSLQFRPREERVRSGRTLVTAWFNDPLRMSRATGVYPYCDELWCKPLRDKYAEIKAKGLYAHVERTYEDNIFVEQSYTRRQSEDPVERVYIYLCAKRQFMLIKRIAGVHNSIPLFNEWSAIAWTSLAQAGAAYIREMLRETSFARKILPPTFLNEGTIHGEED